MTDFRPPASQIPRDTAFDSSLALLSNGYRFISKRRQRYGSDLFETRLLLQKAICVTGEDAARMFYHPGRFTRVGAMPPTTLMLLQDKGSVQTLDGEAHRQRKQMFMSLMTPASIEKLTQAVAEQWRAHLARWETMETVALHDEVRGILCRAACRWAAVPLTEAEAQQRTREFGAMIDGAGSVGPRNWWALLLRTRTERWASKIIGQVRAGKLHAPEGSAAHVIAWHREPDGALLEPALAAVELLNILRPTVAIARFVTFAALALYEFPEYRQRLQAGDDTLLEWFVQEVRRYYPFFPFIAGRVRQPFEWQGHRFAAGTWVILDLYGTNHDERVWQDPEVFYPERFRDWDGSAFNFIPQGGGDYEDGHRCAGEWATIAVLKTAVRLLSTAMRYDLPPQNLRVSLSKMPALPQSGFVIRNVRQMAGGSSVVE
ncbi:MAG TPA: cytochrome P450 [Caldilineaceae bacterium]|nr:cytochrome P450 [Caldilineaceae bacterium]